MRFTRAILRSTICGAALCTAGWNLSTQAADKAKADARPNAAALIKRGDYLVNEVARCGDCHTPRNNRGQLDNTRALQGAAIWFTPKVKPKEWEGKAPDITMSGKPGKWSEEKMIKYLSTGGKGEKPEAPMPAYHLSQDDARAVTAYLRSLRGAGNKGKREKDDD
jgi:mono/diheme cytochrome c family protein